MKTVSFDYDGVLSNNQDMVRLAKGFLKDKDLKVIILTSRKNQDMEQVYATANNIGILEVLNTNYVEKNIWLNMLQNIDIKNSIDLHIDDDLFEVQALQSIGVNAIYIHSDIMDN